MAHHHHLGISRSELDRAEKLARRALRRDPDIGGPAGRKAGLLCAGEVLGAAFLTGVAKGRFGPISLGPVPADLIGGGALLLAGFFGGKMFGKATRHLWNVGLGVGAGYTHTLGAGVGINMATKATTTTTKLSGSRLAGALGRGAAPLTQAELAAMARAVR